MAGDRGNGIMCARGAGDGRGAAWVVRGQRERFRIEGKHLRIAGETGWNALERTPADSLVSWANRGSCLVCWYYSLYWCSSIHATLAAWCTGSDTGDAVYCSRVILMNTKKNQN